MQLVRLAHRQQLQALANQDMLAAVGGLRSMRFRMHAADYANEQLALYRDSLLGRFARRVSKLRHLARRLVLRDLLPLRRRLMAREAHRNLKHRRHSVSKRMHFLAVAAASRRIAPEI